MISPQYVDGLELRIKEQDAYIETLMQLLEAAQAGLNWYRDAHPQDDSEADAEHEAKVRAALAAKPALDPKRLSPGVLAILAERQRQIAEEGWTADHDDDHDPGDLAAAASAYALNAADQLNPYSQGDGDNRPWGESCMWPWDGNWWKPSTPKRDLEKAGALVAAEWDRLDREEKRHGA